MKQIESIPRDFFPIVAAARILKQNKNTVAGSGLPIIASVLASELSARHTTLFDSGSLGPIAGKLPVSVSDGNIDFEYQGSGASILGGALQTGRIDSCIVGAGQIDASGKLNSSRIFNQNGFRQLPGPGGAPAMVAYANTVVILTAHDTRRFPTKCDFVSSDPVSTSHAFGRQRTVFVITHECVLQWSFSKLCFEAKLLLQPKSSIEVLDEFSFVRIPNELKQAKMPSDAELSNLRRLLGKNFEQWNLDGRVSSKLKDKANG